MRNSYHSLSQESEWGKTGRIELLSNYQVKAWEGTIYFISKQYFPVPTYSLPPTCSLQYNDSTSAIVNSNENVKVSFSAQNDADNKGYYECTQDGQPGKYSNGTDMKGDINPGTWNFNMADAGNKSTTCTVKVKNANNQEGTCGAAVTMPAPTGSIQINATLDSLPVNTTVNISTTEPVNIAFAYNKGNFNVGDTYILSASSKDLPNASVSHCAKEFNPDWSVRADYGCISPSERGYKKADGSTANNNTDSSGNWSVAGGITNDLVNTRWEEWLKIGGFESNHVFVAVSPANNGGRSYNGDRTSYKNYSENYSLPQTFGNLTLGEYKITAVSGGPAGAIFQGISPSDTQTLTSSGPGLTFTLRFKIPVPPPGSFSLSLGALSCNSVSLSWTASSGAQGYRILRNGSDITPYPYTALNFTDTTVSQNAGYSYQIEAYNAGGNTRSNTINAATPYCSPTLSFSGSLLSIFQGQSITLTWSSANTTSCTASGNPTQSNWSGSKSLNGSQNVAPLPPPNVTYTLTCSGPGGSASGSATVNISPLALPEWREIIPR